MPSPTFQLRRMVPVAAVSAQLMEPVGVPAHVVTLMGTSYRGLVDQAVKPGTRVIHADSADQVLRAVRENPVGAFLVSTSIPPSEIRSVRRLVARWTGIRSIAVVDHRHAGTSGELLRLGASGVTEVADLSSVEGWRMLHDALAEGENTLVARIAAVVDSALDDASVSTKRFFGLLIRSAIRIASSRSCASIR